MSMQLVFPRPTTVTRVYPDGREEKVRFGQYEAVVVTKVNGEEVPTMRTITLGVKTSIPVTDVECEDESQLIFAAPYPFET